MAAKWRGNRQSFLSCVKKVRHRSIEQANKVADKMRQKHNQDEFNVYHCGMCHGYHVGRPIHQIDPW